MEYLTEEDYAVALGNGIPKKIVYHRFYILAWTKERTISEPVHDRSQSKEYKALCLKMGIHYRTFYDRMKRGMTTEEALSYKKPKPKITEKEIAIAVKNGISAQTAKLRVYQYKWNVERAITEPIHKELRRKGSAVLSR